MGPRPEPASRRRAVLRRRKVALAALLGAAALVVITLVYACGDDDATDSAAAGAGAKNAGSGDAGSGDAGAKVSRPSIERQVGELLVISFNGGSAPPYVPDALSGGRASGAVLFGRNVSARAQVRALNRELQRDAEGRALIAVDQEGGSIRTLPFSSPREAQATLATPEAAAASARRGARDLREVGVNVTLGPVADVAQAGSALAGRTYPGDAEAVAAKVRAAVEAYGKAGVAATLKHFPGLGDASANTDDAPVTIAAAERTLAERDLPPFEAGIAAGAPLVMTSHALYPALDRKRIASQSRAILTDLLRGRLGFRGAVITDSMEAEAVLRRSSLEQACIRSIEAGVDLLLLTGAGSFPRAREALLREARRSAVFRRRIAESYDRVVALKRRLELPQR